MPLLTSHGETNKVPDGDDAVRAFYHIPGLTNPYEKFDIIEQYRYVGMTLDAARTCAIEMRAAGFEAQVRRASDDGGYEVQVSETVEGEWEEVTPEE